MKKRAAPKTTLEKPAGATIQKCNFQNIAPALNENTRDAAVALAKAAEANANAIHEIAKCLEGAVFEGPMIQIG
jgi:hypothetical protein